MPERHRIIVVINEFQLCPKRFVVKCTFAFIRFAVYFNFKFYVIFFVEPLIYPPVNILLHGIWLCPNLLGHILFHSVSDILCTTLVFRYFNKPCIQLVIDKSIEN